MTEVNKQIRFRINVSVSTRGVYTWDTTVDATGYTQDEVMLESKELVARLRLEYPRDATSV